MRSQACVRLQVGEFDACGKRMPRRAMMIGGGDDNRSRLCEFYVNPLLVTQKKHLKPVEGSTAR